MTITTITKFENDEQMNNGGKNINDLSYIENMKKVEEDTKGLKDLDIKKQNEKKTQEEQVGALKSQLNTVDITNDKLKKAQVICQQILSENFKEYEFKLLGQSRFKGVYLVKNKSTGEIEPNVWKINMQSIIQSLLHKLDPSIEENTVREKNNEKEIKKIHELKGYFETNNILEPTVEKSKININSDIVKNIMQEGGLADKLDINNIKDSYEIEFNCTKKPLAKEKLDGKYISLDFGYTTFLFNKYLGLSLVDTGSENIPVNGMQIKQYLDKRFEYLTSQIEKLGNNESIKQFFKGIIAFTEAKNEILDIYGPDNFTFFLDENKKLDFHIIDPIYPQNIEEGKIGRKYIPVNDKKFEGIDSRNVTFDEYTNFAYSYIVEKMKKYVSVI